MTPNYIARKSKVAQLSIWCILFFWLVIPLIIQIYRIVAANCETIEFYDNKIVHKKGVFNKSENQSVFAGVYAVSINQSFLGTIFGYGDISVDCPGRWDVNTEKIANPKGLKAYLENKITATGMTNIIHN